MMRNLSDHSSTVHPTAWFKLALGASIAIALVAWEAPQRRMPLDYDFMRFWSIPTATLWASIVVLSAFRFRKKAFWLLLGAPLVLYWPIWLALHGLPRCYWRAACK